MRIRRRNFNRLLIKTLLVVVGYLIGCAIMDSAITATVGPGGSSFSSCKGAKREEGETMKTKRTVTKEVFDQTLMIGVMTTRQNLDSRAAAIFATWGREVPGLVVFYVGKESNSSYSSTSSSSSVSPSAAANESSSGRARTEHFSEDVDAADRVHTEPIRLVNDLLVVMLEGVTDEIYPPRDKCFAMLRHMHTNFGNRFRWFLRADDDVYVRAEPLIRFLNSQDDTKLWYMGLPGIGVPSERGLLGLKEGQTYCLGGPGVIFSSVSLALLVPHLKECAQSSVTSHEDTELGRCVIRHLHKTCTTDKEIHQLFLQDYRKFLSSGRQLQKTCCALTIHPIKEPRIMHQLHSTVKNKYMQDLMARKANLLSEVNKMVEETETAVAKNTAAVNGGPSSGNTSATLGGEPVDKMPSSNGRQVIERFVESKLIQDVDHFAGRNSSKAEGAAGTGQSQTWLEWLLQTWGYELRHTGADSSNAAKVTDKESLVLELCHENNPTWLVAVIQNRAQKAHSSVVHHGYLSRSMLRELTEFRRANYEQRVLKSQFLLAHYHSYTTVHGPQFRVTYYSPGKGYQSFILSSTWQDLHWRELAEHRSPDSPTTKDVNRPLEESSRPMTDDTRHRKDFFSLKKEASLKESLKWSEEDDSSAEHFRRDEGEGAESHGGLPRAYDAPAAAYYDGGDVVEQSSWPDLTVLLPLSGRHETYIRFLKQLTTAASHYPARVHLRVALYPDSRNETELNRDAGFRFFPQLSVTVVFNDQQPFSRASAINAIAEGMMNDSSALLFITDVDLVITPGFLFRAALNVRLGTAYFPIFFSRYSQDVYCYGRSGNCSMDPSDFGRDAGMWRHFSYGMQVLTARDFHKTRGYDTTIVGWGKEDVNFYQRCITMGIEIFRAPDTGLVHPFHTKICDPTLSKDQLSMCLGSKYQTFGSTEKLSEIITDIKEFQK